MNRDQELTTSGIITARDLESAKATYDGSVAKNDQALAQVTVAEAQVSAAVSGVEEAKASLDQNKASLKLQQVNLDYTIIKTPIDGVVVSRSVDVGQTVAASLSAPTLFIIANDLRQMQVIANIDEADIGKISDQVQVRFTVDAFTGKQFSGQIVEIRLNSQTAQNVVTYNVIINVDNSSLDLKPGMTANIVMTVAEVTNALRVPNSALRFRPTDKTPEEVRKITQDAIQQARNDQGNGANQQPKPDAPTTGGDQSKNAPPAAGGPPAPGGPQPPQGQGGGNGPGGGGRPGGGMPPVDTKGLSPAAAAAMQKMRDPSISREDRQAIMAGLSDDDKAKIREKFQIARSQQGGGQPGGPGGPGGPAGGNGGGRGGNGGGKNGGGKGNKASGGMIGVSGGSTFNIPTQKSVVASGIEPEAANKIKFPLQVARTGRPTIIWVLTKDKKVEPRVITTGITDGQYTEITSSQLKEGDVVIIGQTVQGGSGASQSGTNPFSPKPQGGPGGGGRPPGR